jgi:fatty acid desaturase
MYIIDGKKYDLTDFIKFHPGGNDIKYYSFDKSNMDISRHYTIIHQNLFPHENMKQYLLEDSNKKLLEISDFGKDLYKRVNLKKYNRLNILYYIKSISITSIMLLFNMLFIITGSYMYAILSGLFISLWSLNVGHDTFHGVINNNFYCTIMKICNIFTGFDHNIWIKNHNIHHHIYTNDIILDNDIKKDPIFALYPSSNKNVYNKFQSYYLFPLFLIYGFKFPFNKSDSIIYKILYLLKIISPLIFNYNTNTILGIILLLCIQGFIFGALFIINHNFVGVKKGEKIDCWYKYQVENSCSYGGKIACFLTGGLNYQIEHHLFPHISYIYYPEIQPIVRELCKKYNINYTYFPTYWDNIKSTLKHLYRIVNITNKNYS